MRARAPRRILLVLCAVVLVAGVGAWLAGSRTPEPVPLEKGDDLDTGLSREATEERLRTIGYVQ